MDCNVVDSLLINNAVFESLGIQLNINKNNYTLQGVYHPPSSSLSAFDLEFSSVLNRINTNCIMMGDFNVGICSDHRFPSACIFLDIYSTVGYNSLIDVPTRVTRNSITCFDHIYVITPLSNKWGVIKTSVSDYYAFFYGLPNIKN